MLRILRRQSRRSWLRGVVVFLAGIIAACVLERYMFTGLIVPVRIVSGSMAPHLRGPHGQSRCEDCQFPFAWDATTVNADTTRVCPNCGATTSADRATWQQGQRVLIRRIGYRPRRWDTVVVNLSHDRPAPTRATARNPWSVKRIVGLPGERIILRSGEVWIDQQRLQKDWSAQRRLCLLVHDDAYRTNRPVVAPSDRWLGNSASSCWKTTRTGYQWQSPTRDHHRPPSPTEDWLKYQHRACFASPLFRRSELPLRDHYGYNQSLSRPLHEVSDLFVHFRCRLQGPQTSPPAALQVRVHDGHGVLCLQWNLAGEFELTDGDQFHWTTQLAPLPKDRWFRVVAGTWDGQAVLVIDGLERVRTSYPPSSQAWQPQASPLAIRTQGWTQVDLRDISVWRDIYYTHPNDLEADWSMATPLGPDEYLLLGDNSPASLDGRHGRQRGVVHRNQIIGSLIPQPSGVYAAQ